MIAGWYVLPTACVCVTGGALKAMVGVLRALVGAGVPGCGRRELLAMLTAPVQRDHHPHTAHATKQVHTASHATLDKKR